MSPSSARAQSMSTISPVRESKDVERFQIISPTCALKFEQAFSPPENVVIVESLQTPSCCLTKRHTRSRPVWCHSTGSGRPSQRYTEGHGNHPPQALQPLARVAPRRASGAAGPSRRPIALRTSCLYCMIASFCSHSGDEWRRAIRQSYAGNFDGGKASNLGF